MRRISCKWIFLLFVLLPFLAFASDVQKSETKKHEFENNPCFKTSLELIQNPPKEKPSKEKLERAQKLIQQKLKILKEHQADPRLALQKQSGVELEECRELMAYSVSCTFSKCQELQKSLYKFYESMPESEAQKAYDSFLAVYLSVSDPEQALSLSEKLLVPEMEKAGLKVGPKEVEAMKALEKNESDVEANKKSKQQGYLDAILIMKKAFSKQMTGRELQALEESQRAAQAFSRGEIDEAELQVRTIEAYARAAGEKISFQERETLLREIRKNAPPNSAIKQNKK